MQLEKVHGTISSPANNTELVEVHPAALQGDVTADGLTGARECATL